MENLLPLITGGGGALVVLSLWVWALAAGKLHSGSEFEKLETENAGLRAAADKLTEALALERQRSNDATQAGTVTNQLIGGLVQLATANRAAEKHEHDDAAAKLDGRALPLTAKDPGL